MKVTEKSSDFKNQNRRIDTYQKVIQFERRQKGLSYLEAHIPNHEMQNQKRKRKNLLAALNSKLSDIDIWQAQSVEEKERLRLRAKKCALIFQRSSSCVEGRNGQMSLRLHSSRKMSSRKLAASTVIHNYLITRPDGRTAAERFFEQPPDDLFEWLLANTDCPPLPAKRRSKPGKLYAVA